MIKFFHATADFLIGVGNAFFFLLEVLGCLLRGRVRWGEVFKQVYEQGVQSVVIVILMSVASGAVLALQGFVMLNRFGAKEYVSHLVALSLVRELSPVFTSFIFSGKAGARIAAELGTMSVNDQITATRTMGVDPMDFLVVPRLLAAFLVLPGLVILSEFVGILGGYLVGVYEANIQAATYFHHTLRAVTYVDFFSGFLRRILRV